LSVLFIDQGPSEESIELLLRQLELGLPATALPLAELPISLARGEYLALHSRGITSVANVWALTAEELGAMLGKLRATQLEAYRKSS